MTEKEMKAYEIKVKKAFPHVDLSTDKKLRDFIRRIIPIIELKQSGKIKTQEDGSGTFLKKDLEEIKRQYD